MSWRRTLPLYVLALTAFLATLVPLGAAEEPSDVSLQQAEASGEGHSGEAAAQPVKAGRSAWLSRWVLWPLGLAEFWLVGSLSAWGILLWVAPLKIRQINDRLSAVSIGDWQLSDGTQVTLAHLVFVRAFVSNERVVDAWIQSWQAALAEWHAIDFSTSDVVEIEVRGERFAVDDAAAFRCRLSGKQACLALYGESRRWDARVLNGLLRLALHPQAESRLLSHPLLPVVLDRKCLERLMRRESTAEERGGTSSDESELRRLLHSELQRVDGLKADVTNEWLSILLEKHRVLVVVEDWHRTPVQTRNLVTQAYQSNEIAYLVIVSGGATMPSLRGLIQLSAPAEAMTALTSERESAPLADAVEPSTAAEGTPTLTAHSGADDASGIAMETAREVESEALPAANEPVELKVVAAESDEEVSLAVGTPAEPVGEALVADAGCTSENAAEGGLPVLVRFPTVVSESAVDSADATEEAVAVAESRNAQAQPAQPPAGEMLERLGSAACSVIPTLGQALDSSNVSLRQQAVDQLSGIVLTALPELEAALSDGEASVRRNAAHTLVRIEKLMTSAVAHAINDPDASVRREAVAALPSHEERTLEPLTAALGDAQAETRQHAARALGAKGSLAAPAVASLIELLSDENTACRSEAAIALGRIGSAAIAACPSLTETLLEDSRTVRAAAAQALCRIGHVDSRILSALCEASEDSDPTVRLHAVVALGQLGLGHPEALTAIRGALSDDAPAIRSAACHSLSELGPTAKEAIGDLEPLLHDVAVEVRRAVVSSVSQIDLASVPLLRRALDDVDTEVRRIAAAALSGIGLAVMPRLLERDDADEILAGLKRDSTSLSQYEERSA